MLLVVLRGGVLQSYSKLYCVYTTQVRRGRHKAHAKASDSSTVGCIYRKTPANVLFKQKYDVSTDKEDLKKRGYKELDLCPQIPILPPGGMREVPMIHHQLEKVLFEPGVHLLYDGNKYLLPKDLQHIYQPDEFDMSKFPRFITSSMDKDLHSLAITHSCKFKGSTSSVSGPLSHLYYLFSRFKLNDTSALPSFSMGYTTSFTPSSLKPTIFFARPREGIYSVDKDNTGSSPTILTQLGKLLEIKFTTTTPQYRSLLKQSDDKDKWKPPEKEAYNYTQVGSMLFRSQIDCHHPGLSKKYFDLKTRASQPIRINMANYKAHTHRHISKIKGDKNSFESEFYDMIRSAFLKYIIQVKIGQMDGIFVAYHNTTKIYGFEYIPLHVMERCVFETQAMANKSFEVITTIFNRILDELTQIHPGVVLKIAMKTMTQSNSSVVTNVFVEKIPIDKDKGWTENEIVSRDQIKAEYQVHLYLLSLEIIVNGLRTKGQVCIQDNDTVDILYKFNEIQHSKIVEEYSKILYEHASLEEEVVYDKDIISEPTTKIEMERPKQYSLVGC